MKRQIKFRGKRVDTGEWVYGSLLSLHPDILESFVRKRMIIEIIGNIHDNPELLKGGKECKY